MHFVKLLWPSPSRVLLTKTEDLPQVLLILFLFHMALVCTTCIPLWSRENPSTRTPAGATRWILSKSPDCDGRKLWNWIWRTQGSWSRSILLPCIGPVAGGRGAGVRAPPKSAKRSTFSHKVGQEWGFCRRVRGVRFKKVHFLGPKDPLFGGLAPPPPKSILATGLPCMASDSISCYWPVL